MGLWAPSLIDNNVHILMKQKWRASGAGAGRALLAYNANCREKEIYQKQQYIDESNAFAFWQVKYICGIWYSYVYMITIYPIWYFFLTD